MAITSANLANAILKLVAVDALPEVMGSLVMGNLVRRDFEPVVAGVADTVIVPYPGGPGRVPQIVITTPAEATFQVPDVTKILAVPDLLKLYMQPAIVAVAERIESDLLSLCGDFNVHAPIGAAGTPLTEEKVDEAGTVLFRAGALVSSPKYLVVDAATYSQLRRIDHFSEYSTAGDAGLRVLADGTVGKLRDFYVFRSLFVPRTGSAPIKTHNMAFTREAITLAIRRLPQPMVGSGLIAEYAEMGSFGIQVTMNYQPNTLAQQFTIGVLYGVGVVNPLRGVEVWS